MEVNRWVELVHKNAVDHGWWSNGERSPLEIAALIHSEVSEFVEEARKPDAKPFYWHQAPGDIVKKDPKPEGMMIELADVVIRVMDYFGKQGWNLNQAIEMKHEYNKTREHRHGGKTY